MGARGKTGPTNTSGYLGTSLEGKVTLDNGIQIWTVPVTGIYVIEVSGASGASSKNSSNDTWRLGGLGAKISGTFKLQQGTQLKSLLVKRVIVVWVSVTRQEVGEVEALWLC